MPLVLAIEPDVRQATIIKRIVREQVRADLILVDSRDAALAAIEARIPDVILLTALLSPRDEGELVSYLRTLGGAHHVQTHTIPQLASSPADVDSKTSGSGGGLFGKLLRRRDQDVTPFHGCDPNLFAEEIRTFVDRAAERKNETVQVLQQRLAHLEFQAKPPVEADTLLPGGKPADPTDTPGSAWASPFEWRRSTPGQVQTSQPPSPLVTNVPLAGVTERQEQQAGGWDLDDEAEPSREEEERQWLDDEAKLKSEQDDDARKRLETEAKLKREEEERKRLEAEAERRREEAEAERKREEGVERKRLEAEAKRKREEEERKRLEAEAKRKREEEERKRLEAEAKRRREEEERKRLEAEAKRRREEEEKERKRLEAEAQRRREEAEAKRKREEEERKRLEAEAKRKREEAETKRKREEEERKRLEAEAKRKREEAEAKRKREEERKRFEAEAKRKREEEEHKRLEAEAKRKREEEERRRLEAEAKRRREEEERKRLEAEAIRKREEEERKRLEAEAIRKREEEERKRLEAEAKRKREEAEAERRRREAEEKLKQEKEEARRREEAEARRREPDQIAEFRAEHDEPKGVLRLMPITTWARVETPHQASDANDAPVVTNEFQKLIASLRIPPQVASISYPRGCRIRRVRVRASKQAASPGGKRQALIVSRRALRHSDDSTT